MNIEFKASGKILIVDDEPINIGILANYLANIGFEINMVKSGKRALEQCQYELPDLILLDVMMPDMSGFETCRRLKDNPATKDIPVIFMTALSDLTNKMEGFAVGAVDYVTKPFQIEEIIARVNTHITVRNLQKQLEAQNAQMQQEIIERKRIEKELRHSEEWLKTLFESAPDAYYISDLQGNFVNGNIVAQELVGYKREELIGKNFLKLKLLSPEQILKAATLLAKNVLGQPTGPDEFTLHRKDGHQVPVEIRTVPITIKEQTLVLGIARDIIRRKQTEEELEKYRQRLEELVKERTTELTMVNEQLQHEITERKQVKKSLRESEERFRQFISSISDHVYVTIITADGNRDNLYVSPNVEALTGFPRIKFTNDWHFWNSVVIHPDDRARATAQAMALANGQSGEVEYRLIRADSEVIWVRDSARVETRDNTKFVYGVVSDITTRKLTEAALHRYTNRLQVLHDIDQGILTAQSAEAIAQVALKHIRQLVPCQGAGVVLFDFTADEFVVLAVDINTEIQLKQGIRASLKPLGDHIKEMRQGSVVTDEEVGPQERITKILYGEPVNPSINVPLTVQGELIGFLNLAATRPRVFIEEHLDIARQVADQLAVAIHQARLHEQVQHYAKELEQRVVDRTRELLALYEVTAMASESLDLQTTLEQSLERVRVAMRSNMGVIHLLDKTSREEAFQLVIEQGLPANVVAHEDCVPLSGLTGWVVEHGEPLIVPDIISDPRAVEISNLGPQTAYVGVPIRARGRVLGVLGILKEKEQPQFTMSEITLLTFIADHVGIVVESARLRQRAEQAAVLEERERLARELHDSVTQSLYSLALFAEWGRRLYEAGDMEAAKQRVIRIGETAQQALKEMRLLVYELRPAILEQDGLVRALQRRLDAVEKRAGLEVSLQVESLIELPLPVEEGLYRIAQEALNNALKHTTANLVTVRVWANDRQVMLEVEDNGEGFVPEEASDKGGLGLVSMQERAERLGGVFTIISAPGAGTKIQAAIEVSQ